MQLKKHAVGRVHSVWRQHGPGVCCAESAHEAQPPSSMRLEHGRALSPRAAMAEAGGPRKRMLDAVSASAAGSSGFSDA